MAMGRFLNAFFGHISIMAMGRFLNAFFGHISRKYAKIAVTNSSFITIIWSLEKLFSPSMERLHRSRVSFKPLWRSFYAKKILFPFWWNVLIGAALQRCSYKKVFWKYPTNLRENTLANVILLKSHFGMSVLL